MFKTLSVVNMQSIYLMHVPVLVNNLYMLFQRKTMFGFVNINQSVACSSSEMALPFSLR